MSEEIWMADVRREAAWDCILARRPRCADCGEPIAEERCFDLGGGDFLCSRCVRLRMADTKEL